LTTLQTTFRRARGDGPVLIDRLALVRQDNPYAAFCVFSAAQLCRDG